MSMNLIHTLKMDATWFQEHPKAECRLRPMVPAEFPEHLLEGEQYVLVTPAGRGVMHKLPMKLYTEYGVMPTELMWIDTGERWHIRPSGDVVPKRKTKRQAWQAFLDPETKSMIEIGREMLGGAL